jgi:aminobenzoyl-glutamate utilization protein B
MSLMREHILPTARIHRVIKDGGKVANIIPDYPKAADGAALGTETRAKVTVLASVRDPVSNAVLGKVMQKELERVGPPRFDDKDQSFAKALQKDLGVAESGLASEIVPFGPGHGSTASSDIGEVSAVVPLAELMVATRPLGTSSHHWATTSCAAHPVGFRGMHVAAKVLGASLVDLLADRNLVVQAKDEFAKATQGKPYVSPLAADARPTVF